MRFLVALPGIARFVDLVAALTDAGHEASFILDVAISESSEDAAVARLKMAYAADWIIFSESSGQSGCYDAEVVAGIGLARNNLATIGIVLDSLILRHPSIRRFSTVADFMSRIDELAKELEDREFRRLQEMLG